MPAHIIDEFLDFRESLLVDFNRLLMASELLGAVLHLPFFLVHADGLASLALATMEILELFTEVAEVGLAFRANLIITSTDLFDLHTTLVVRTGFSVSLLVDCIEAVLVFAGVTLICHWIEDVHAREAPLNSALAVNILTARS